MSTPREHIRKGIWPGQDNQPEDEDTPASPREPKQEQPEQPHQRTGIFEPHEGQRRYGGAGGW